MKLKLFEVSFSVPCRRHVAIAVPAEHGSAAIYITQQELAEGRLFNDTPLVKLLRDEHVEQGVEGISFMSCEISEAHPDESARALHRNVMAMRACEALVAAYRVAEESGGGVSWEDVDEAHRIALEAVEQ